MEYMSLNLGFANVSVGTSGGVAFCERFPVISGRQV